VVTQLRPQTISNSYACARSLFQPRQQYLINYGTHRCGWPITQSSRIVEQYAMFLYIASIYPSRHLVPSAEIDAIWEADILHSTAQYAQTCEQLCGRIIHHAKVEELEQRPDFPGVTAAFKQTQRLFSQHFGEDLLGMLTPTAAACGVL